jgi:hypothetical protein
MLNYLKKFTMDILPSVAATIIGAYIVNHYITARPAEAPVAAAVSSADPKKPDSGGEARPAETSGDVANIPEPGVKARGISERAMIEKSAAEKPATAADRPQAEKSAEKSADKPAETASIPAVDSRHKPAAPREKAVAKVAPPPVVAPTVAAPVTAPPTDAAAASDERRDANDLARAAIERLRGTSDGPPRAQEAAHAPEAPRTAEEAPRVASTPPVQPLPPPIMVSTPTAGDPPYTANMQIDPSRPTPPADIPPPPSRPPLDLRADATDPPPARPHTNVAEDMLLAAKSMFHAVLPNSSAK